MASDTDWKRALRNGMLLAATCAAVAVFAAPVARLVPGLDPQDLRQLGVGGAAGALVVAILYRPRRRPGPAERAKIERRSLPLLAVTTVSFCLWFPGLFWAAGLEDIRDTPVWVAVVAGAAFLVMLVTLPFLWTEIRAARADPSLIDERMQRNMDRAYRGAFTATFQIGLLGGLILSYASVPVTPAQVAMGLAVLSQLLWLLHYIWFEWRDGA